MEVGYPLILKPSNGMGTMSTMKVRDRAELVAALADYDFEAEVRSHHLVAEEFIDGEEFHVDAVWRDGREWVLYVSRYFEPRLQMWAQGGLDGSVMLPEEDYPDLYATVRTMHMRLNAAIGLSRGTTHFEIFRERATGRFVCSEIASRFGGACVVEVVRAKCGVDERHLWAHELLDGELHDLARTAPAFRYVGWLNISPTQSGVITHIPDHDEIVSHPNVVSATVAKSAGAEVHRAHPSEWCVLVTFGADTEVDFAVVAKDLATTFQVEVS